MVCLEAVRRSAVATPSALRNEISKGFPSLAPKKDSGVAAERPTEVATSSAYSEGQQ